MLNFHVRAVHVRESALSSICRYINDRSGLKDIGNETNDFDSLIHFACVHDICVLHLMTRIS